jgi:recombination protein RecR
MENIDSINRLISDYKKLPGIGNKTAERLSYATLNFTKEELQTFVLDLQNVIDRVHRCPRCGMNIDTPNCPICDDLNRDNSILMVLTNSKSVLSFEKTKKYFGKYFILGGSISPIKGITANDVRIPELVEYVKENNIKEVIVSCDSTLEGEITSQYIFNSLNPLNIKVTRLAYGLPIGADLEYIDEKTIELSLSSRKEMKGGN